MSRKIAVGVLVLTLVVVLASVAGASDQTEASTYIMGMGNTTASWASGLLIVGFVLTIIGLILGRFYDVKAIMAVPITFIIIGAILKAGPQILAPFAALGATLR